MKMTMKNELTLKHGVILAAAVLLVAGIAFAGAAAAEATHINWEKTALDSAISTGGYYIVDVPSNSISNLYTSKILFSKDLTLDFNYTTVYIGNSYGVKSGTMNTGGLFSLVAVDEGTILTIKNLVIDGGVTVKGDMVGSVIGFIENSGGKVGSVVLENISVKNVNVSGSWFCGGLVGATSKQDLSMVNCSLDDSRVSLDGSGSTTSYGYIGGMNGYCNGHLVIERCYVNNTYISDEGVTNNYCGLLAGNEIGSAVIVKDCCVVNTIVDSTASGNSNVGLIGCVSKADVSVKGCIVNNCVISGTYSAGGAFGSLERLGSYVVTAENNTISSTTIVNTGSSGKAGGFAGGLNQTAVNSISNNTITNCCVVATNGNAAGFCPAVV